jgi:hypothetical protein
MHKAGQVEYRNNIPFLTCLWLAKNTLMEISSIQLVTYDIVGERIPMISI